MKKVVLLDKKSVVKGYNFTTLAAPTLNFNPRLTKGGFLQPPLRFFPGRSQSLKKVTKGI